MLENKQKQPKKEAMANAKTKTSKNMSVRKKRKRKMIKKKTKRTLGLKRAMKMNSERKKERPLFYSLPAAITFCSHDDLNFAYTFATISATIASVVVAGVYIINVVCFCCWR